MYVDYNKRGRKGNEYYRKVFDGINEFRKVELLQIPEDESRNSGCHIEASFLSHGVWTKIMENKSNKGMPYSDNWFLWKSSENEMTEVLFHFDVMNNSKCNNKKYSSGLFRICCEDERKLVEEIYHSIGNIAPIPWFETMGGNYIDGQKLHASVDERWDIYLQLLKDNWISWNSVSKYPLTFEKYMILTCQQMYYKDIYNVVKDTLVKDITIKDIDYWNNMITEESQLLDFSTIQESGNIADIITKLIKIRCKEIQILLDVK